MRTEKELWEVVLSRPDLFDWGLCFWVLKLRMGHFISEEEFLLLDDRLDKNLPSRIEYGFYCWPRWQIQYRIDWINERIKQL